VLVEGECEVHYLKRTGIFKTSFGEEETFSCSLDEIQGKI
jgi:hypothetical protein